MFTLVIKGRSFSLVKRLSDLRNRLAFRTIKRSSKSYLNERGWRKTGSFPSQEYHGWYRCPYGSWKGRVLASTSNPCFYLYKPPTALKLKHPHNACFSSQGDGWFSVHFRTVPRDIDSGVIAIERILTECMRLK
jgi:hypothetical protein